MVFRRKGRPSLYFQARTQTGYKQLSTDTPNRVLANKIEAMWGALASEHRAWDILSKVLAGGITIGTLYDKWTEAKYGIAALRRNLEDVDVAVYVQEFLAVHRRSVTPDTAAHVAAHLRDLLPASLMRSQITTEYLTQLLHGYPGKRNTLRKVHSGLSVYLEYLTDVKGLFDFNPMDKVERPEVERSPIKYYEMDAVTRIIGAQPTLARRALLAVQYGAALDISTTLGLTRADVWPATQEIRAAGTKAHTRDRVCGVADWAWTILANYIEHMLPSARLFPVTWNRWTCSDWHRETVKGLGLPIYPLRNARDHWAVRQLRAGAPVSLVQAQLGHGSPMQTLTKYGRFIPSAADRAKWEKEASKSDRLSAKGGAKLSRKKLSNSRGGT